MPKNVNKEIQEFIKEIQKLLGTRLKKDIIKGRIEDKLNELEKGNEDGK